MLHRRITHSFVRSPDKHPDYEPIDPIAQLNSQAFGSHAIVDEDFDHFEDEDTFLHREDRVITIYGASNAF